VCSPLPTKADRVWKLIIKLQNSDQFASESEYLIERELDAVVCSDHVAPPKPKLTLDAIKLFGASLRD
jgi:hypothetical protein